MKKPPTHPSDLGGLPAANLRYLFERHVADHVHFSLEERALPNRTRTLAVRQNTNLKSDVVLAAEIRKADEGDPDTFGRQRDGGTEQSESGRQPMSEAVGLRTYILEPRRRHRLRWTDKPAAYQPAVYANRRRIKRATSKRRQRRRSELCERTFAQVRDRGGTRRSWLCVEKRSAEFVQIGCRNVLASGGSARRTFLPLGACSP